MQQWPEGPIQSINAGQALGKHDYAILPNNYRNMDFSGDYYRYFGRPLGPFSVYNYH